MLNGKERARWIRGTVNVGEREGERAASTVQCSCSELFIGH